MRTYKAVEDAVTLVSDILEANYKVADNHSIRQRVLTWYEHTDIADPQMLAACALTGRDWFPAARYKWMLAAKEEWFPQVPLDCCENSISVLEMKEVADELLWR
jgi:hypothetical protein